MLTTYGADDAGSEPTPLDGPQVYLARLTGPRQGRLGLMQAALAMARDREIDAVHLKSIDLDLSLVQVAEFAAELRRFGVELVVPDCPGLDPASDHRAETLEVMARLRFRDHKRHRGNLRLLPPLQGSAPKMGRPRRAADLAAAISLLDEGESVMATSVRLNIPLSTLRRRLDEVA